MESEESLGIVRRLVSDAAPASWTAVCVKVVPAGSHEESDVLVHTPDHWLAAAWPPAANGFTRWPEAVVIGSPTPARALSGLLAHLPADATAHLASIDDVDAALAAEILLAADRNLEPYQREAIERFARAARRRTLACIAERYSDRDPGFDRFRASVVKDAPGRS